MSIKKPILLFLALALPVVVFVFLKFFGKNEFAVPALFSDRITVPVECEGFRYEIPYSIPDTTLSILKRSHQDSILLVVFSDQVISNQQERSIQLSRIFTEFPSDKFQVFVLTENDEAQQTILTESRLIQAREQKFTFLQNCIFLLEQGDNTVLLDSKGRIRGQYSITDREDVDRLIMEMNIILKKY